MKTQSTLHYSEFYNPSRQSRIYNPPIRTLHSQKTRYFRLIRTSTTHQSGHHTPPIWAIHSANQENILCSLLIITSTTHPTHQNTTIRQSRNYTSHQSAHHTSLNQGYTVHQSAHYTRRTRQFPSPIRKIQSIIS